MEYDSVRCMVRGLVDFRLLADGTDDMERFVNLYLFGLRNEIDALGKCFITNREWEVVDETGGRYEVALRLTVSFEYDAPDLHSAILMTEDCLNHSEHYWSAAQVEVLEVMSSSYPVRVVKDHEDFDDAKWTIREFVSGKGAEPAGDWVEAMRESLGMNWFQSQMTSSEILYSRSMLKDAFDEAAELLG